MHEVTSAQAFEGLRLAGRTVSRPDRTLATADHNVPTDPAERTALDAIADHLSREQVAALERNCEQFGVPIYGMRSARQGIVHVIGPELGLSQPGITIACGDSHTSTHGALGALAMPIGTSEVEHVLATQCLLQTRPRTMRITFEGEPGFGVTAKDLILGTIGQISAAGAVGYVVEYAGDPIARALDRGPHDDLQHVDRGRRAGGDDRAGRRDLRLRGGAPRRSRRFRGGARSLAVAADRSRRHLRHRDHGRHRRAQPAGHVGNEPGSGRPGRRAGAGSLRLGRAGRPRGRGARARVHGARARHGGQDIKVDRVFIGSCTNSRIEDLRVAAAMVEGRRVAETVRAMVVPGSMQVKAQAEREGLDDVFRKAGFEWREAGCSMCLGMNPDILQPGERCASTSNRNFEGRQGRGGRTHLVSPQMAAAAAVEGHFVDIREWGT